MEQDEFEYDEITGDMYDNTYKFPQGIEENEMYLLAKNQIEKHGCISVITEGFNVKYYTPELEAAFCIGGFSLEAYNTKSKVDIKKDEIDFNNCYVAAYIDGRKEFDNIVANSPYQRNLQEYVTFLKKWLSDCKSILKKHDTITIYSMNADGRCAGIFSRIIELIKDDNNLKQRITDLAGNDLELQQRIEKLVDHRVLRPLAKLPPPPIAMLKEPYKFTLDIDKESKVLENYKFWNGINEKQGNKNIFKGITQQRFLEMVSTADFSEINIRGISQRVKSNTIVFLGGILKDNEWIEHALKKLNTTYDNALKRSGFDEYEELKKKFLQ
jgi:hypothetical protein